MEAMYMYNSRHLKSYKQLFQNLYSPFPSLEILFEGFFYIMVLMAVSAAISGAASAISTQLALNYYVAIVIVGAIVFGLTIFGHRHSGNVCLHLCYWHLHGWRNHRHDYRYQCHDN